jgi:hypothetical protein
LAARSSPKTDLSRPALPVTRPQHGDGYYYAAFIRDPGGNRVEAVTSLKADA